MKPAGSYRSLLIQPAFIAYLMTQFMTAFNDNVFKFVVMLIALSSTSGYVDFYYILSQFLFVLPFFIFSGYSGYFTDRYKKNRVIIATKFFELVVMFFAVYYLASENKLMLVVVLFLLSSQSVFLSPAKYGIIPEWFNESEISRVNGMVQLTTFIAIIFGSAIGGILMQYFSDNLVFIGLFLLVLSAVGFIASFFVKSFPASGSNQPWSFNPWSETILGIKVMRKNRLIATTIAGISFFFAVGLALTANLFVFCKEIFALNDLQIGLMNASLGVGIGLGSVGAGWLSGDKIELGLIPMGAIGMTLCLFGLSFTTSSVLTAFLVMILVGLFAGLFIVPLNALLQELPEKHEKGRLIATNNFFNGAAMIIAVLIVGFLQGVAKLRPDNIMFIFACLTLVFSIITLSFNPRFFVRFLIWLIVHLFYRINIINSPNIPKKGPALIVSNHVSYIDGPIISSVLPRFIRYLAHKYYYYHPMLYPLFRLAYAIPIESGNEQKVNESIARARAELIAGHVVCIFAEGRLTRTGNLLPFKNGLERIVEGLVIPIIPIHLDQLWASVFTPRKHKQLFRIPQQFPARVTVTLGDPMPANSKAWQVRLAVQELAVQARVSGQQLEHYLSVEFFKAASNSPFRRCVYDQDNNRFYKFSTFSNQVLCLANRFKKIHKSPARVGLLLPCDYKSVLMNAGLTTCGQSVVNIPLNFDIEDVLTLVEDLQIQRIYASSDNELGALLIANQKAVDINLVLKDLFNDVKSLKWRFLGKLKYVLPIKWIVKWMGVLPRNPEAEVTVIVPEDKSKKYISLSHESVYNNISCIKQVLDCNRYDRFASVLNYNNSFGFIDGLWAPLVIANGIVPVDIKNNSLKAIECLFKQQATILTSHAEFLEYLHHQIPTNLIAHLRYVMCTGPITNGFSETFYDKFGISILTGFGIPELGSFISLNTPNVRSKGHLQRGSKRNSVGHPLPNIAARIVDPMDNSVLEPGMIGILEIKSPARMLGYTFDIMKNKNLSIVSGVDQWFNTKLKAKIDEEGFIFLVNAD